jgi:2-oxo-4-hydroxy-4-carboxy-5-ureidoimidazoline decarboxylase
VDWFNALDEGRARELLRACCAADAWLDDVISGRPYHDRAALGARSAAALATLDWAGVRQALDAHPRIGARVAAAGREADWSRREQSAMATASDDVKAALVAANQAYEQRFGHIFLIFASGRSDTEMLAAARERVAHDDETEHQVVRGELAKIVALRLERLEAS